jgi:hypothetical protein
MSVGQCTRCGNNQKLVGPLHCAEGGPLTCIPCGTEFHKKIGDRQKKQKRFLAAFEFGAPQHAQADELSLELLEDAIRLTHPDRHPPERAEQAARVTAELLALKPFVNPKAPEPCDTSETSGHDLNSTAVTSPDLRDASETSPIDGKVKKPYPCETCNFTIPADYCDACRTRYEADYAARRERDRAKWRQANARRSELRAWRKSLQKPSKCIVCAAEFKARKDKQYCSHACRQKAYRRKNSNGLEISSPRRPRGSTHAPECA